MVEKYDDSLVIFTGAGISKPVGIPDMYEFVPAFVSKIEKELPDRKSLLDDLINNELVDLEELLKRLSTMSDLLKDETYVRLMKPATTEKEVLSGIQLLKEKLLDFVYEKCSAFDEKIADEICGKILGLKDSFLFDRLKIFTTNYDICTESVCEKQNHAVTTGFKTRGTFSIWDRTAFKDPSYVIHIYKLHGSITWFKYGDKIVQMPPIERRLATLQGEKLEVQMLYPLTGKEVFKPPFHELSYILQKTLESCFICIVIGYSFRDEAMNSIFSNAKKENKNLKILLIDPNAEKISARLDFKIEIIPEAIENLDLKEDFSDILQGRSAKLTELAFSLRDEEAFDESIHIGKKALELANSMGDFELAGRSATCVSDCFNHKDDAENSKNYARKAIEAYDKVEEKDGLVFFNSAVCHNRLGDLGEVIKYYKKAEEECSKEGRKDLAEEARARIERLGKLLEK